MVWYRRDYSAKDILSRVKKTVRFERKRQDKLSELKGLFRSHIVDYQNQGMSKDIVCVELSWVTIGYDLCKSNLTFE